jgi:hypothetical protein
MPSRLSANDPARHDQLNLVRNAQSPPVSRVKTRSQLLELGDDRARRWHQAIAEQESWLEGVQRGFLDSRSAQQSSEWCPGAESNHRHCNFQSHALPTELPGPTTASDQDDDGRRVLNPWPPGDQASMPRALNHSRRIVSRRRGASSHAASGSFPSRRVWLIPLTPRPAHSCHAASGDDGGSSSSSAGGPGTR